MHPQFTASDRKRFMDRVTVDPETGCWVWTGDVARRYGRFWFNGANHRSHRIAYQMAGGAIPDGMLVCHTCDNPLCVRNDDEGTYDLEGVPHERRGHLWIGTEADNQRDKALKGRAISGLKLHPERAARGERNGHATHPERTPHGNTSGPRLHPERMARGERHGSRLHPESILRGENHPSHLHPERMAHGDANGSRLHPERLKRGEENGNAKLNEQIVREIRTRYAAGGISQAALAAEYGVRQTQISNVILRKVWAHTT